MRYLLIAFAAIAWAGDAQAISRYQTMGMGCEDVQSVLREEGAAILRWRSQRTPGIPVYGRYVSDGRFCELGEVSTFASVPTCDNARCDVRKCIRPDNDHDRRLRFPDD